MESFIYINDIKHVNLGAINHQRKNYLMVIDLEPIPQKNFFEISNNMTYENIDPKTKGELNKLYNKSDDIMNAKVNIKLISLGLSLTLLIDSTYLLHGILQRNNPFTNKEAYITLQLHNTSNQDSDNMQLTINDEIDFQKQLSKNKHLSEHERTLLTKLNEKLTTNFENVNFTNFYKNIATVKCYYQSPAENEYLKNNKNVVAYYNKPDNTIVISTDAKKEYVDFYFSHESLHMARWNKDVKYTYPFDRLLNEGGAEIINRNIYDSKKPTTYTFEPLLVNFIISIIGPRQFFASYFSSNDEPIVSALASNLKDRDMVIAMLSYAEEYSEEKDKLSHREADSFKVQNKPINIDENGNPYVDDGWTMTSSDTQSREVWVRPDIGINKKMWDNFINLYDSLLTLYYNKQVEKIMSDYYINGDEWQNMLHFIADTNRFNSFFGDVCVNAFEDADRYNYFVEGYGLVDESEIYEPVREKVNSLKKLYCEIHNISLETLKNADMRYQPAIINALDDFEYYNRLTGNKENVFDAAYKDIIVVMSNEMEISEDGFKYDRLYREAKYCVNHYKPTDGKISLGYSKTK